MLSELRWLVYANIEGIRNQTPHFPFGAKHGTCIVNCLKRLFRRR